MIKKVLFFLFICCPLLSFGQFEVSINAYVLDGTTNKPIEFVNIGFVDKGVGTVSNSEGKFELVFDEQEMGLQAPLQLSTIGYKTKIITVANLYRLLDKNNIIYLNPIAYDLDEVVLTNEIHESKTLGNSFRNTKVMGYWKDKKGLGGEIATRVRVNRANTLLKELSFEVIDNQSDSLKVRVNIYDYKKRYPAKNILSQNIYHTISRKEGIETISLRPYNIYVSDDIVVSIELVEVFGETIEFAVASSADRGIAYTRSISQDKWVRFPSVGMGFSLSASIPKSSGEDLVSRETPDRVTLYWDSSYAMRNRNFEEEFTLLESYLKKVGKVSLQAVRFAAGIRQEQLFDCNKGNCPDLFEFLKESVYLGATDFAQILNQNDFDAQAIILFSNGQSLLSQPKTNLNLPMFSINSMSDANHVGLQDLSLFADGHYIDLSRIEIGDALTLMLNEVEDQQVYSIQASTASKIYGQVSSESGPVQGAIISVKGTYKQVTSNQEGNYSIDADMDDVLEVSALGMLDKAVLVAAQKKLDIELQPDGELLDEVLVEAKKDEEKVNTPYGQKVRRGLGFAADFILAEDIPQHYTNLGQLLAGRAGIQVFGFGDDAQFVFSRSIGSSINNSVLPVIVVDGILYEQAQRPLIDMQNIDNVAIFRGIAAINRWGSLAAFGAIVIETKTYALTGQPIAKPKQALVTGNDYEELTPVLTSVLETPDYIIALQKAQSMEEAQAIYKAQLKTLLNRGIDYFIDVARYFEQWNMQYSYHVASNIAAIAPTNVKALRTLGYYLDAINKNEALTLLYQKIIALEPAAVQGYRDLALAYTKAEQYEKAFDLYKNLLAGNLENVSTNGLGEVIENELRHFMLNYKDKVRYSDLPPTLLTADFKYDIRLVFEYNDPAAQFELQFVNPKNKFFKWVHTTFDNKERLLEEVSEGYTMEEYIIEGDSHGRWVINMTDFAESQSLNPTFLKATLYKNYGLPSESKESVLVNLADVKNKATVLEFSY